MMTAKFVFFSFFIAYTITITTKFP